MLTVYINLKPCTESTADLVKCPMQIHLNEPVRYDLIILADCDLSRVTLLSVVFTLWPAMGVWAEVWTRTLYSMAPTQTARCPFPWELSQLACTAAVHLPAGPEGGQNYSANRLNWSKQCKISKWHFVCPVLFTNVTFCNYFYHWVYCKTTTQRQQYCNLYPRARVTLHQVNR